MGVLRQQGGAAPVESVNGAIGAVVLDAGDIEVTPVGGVAATDVQAAIAELDTEISSLSAGDIGVTPVGDVAATDVQAAISELDTDKLAVDHLPMVVVEPSGTAATNVTNINAAIVAVAAAGGGVVQLLGGTYQIDSPILIGGSGSSSTDSIDNVTLRGVGIATIIEAVPSTWSGLHIMQISADRRKLNVDCNDITRGDTQIVATTASQADGLVAGDILLLKGVDLDSQPDHCVFEVASNVSAGTGIINIKGVAPLNLTSVTMVVAVRKGRWNSVENLLLRDSTGVTTIFYGIRAFGLFCRFNKLWFDSAVSTANNNSRITLSNSVGSRFEHCYMEDMPGGGINVHDHCVDTVIRHCDFTRINQANGFTGAVALGEVTDTFIEECSFSNVLSFGIYLQSIGQAQRRTTITNCIVRGFSGFSTRDFIFLGSAVETEVSNCEFNGHTMVGTNAYVIGDVGAACDNLRVIGNSFNGISYGMALTGGIKNVTVASNVFTKGNFVATSDAAIYIATAGTTNILIDGNRFEEMGRGVWVGNIGTGSVIIQNNLFTNITGDVIRIEAGASNISCANNHHPGKTVNDLNTIDNCANIQNTHLGRNMWILPTAVSVTASRDFVLCDHTEAITVTLPVTGIDRGRVIVVKDGSGDAATNNITVQAASGNIDGGATSVISANYGVRRFIWDGVEWWSVS